MDGYGKRVLIIDDNEDILYLTGVALMGRGYNVYTASDGLDGSEQMNKRRYDVVLVDYQMPRLDGLQFIDLCRMKWPEMPIILMSGGTVVSDRSDAVVGAFGCIAKPFDLTRLFELVNQACRNCLQGEPSQHLAADRLTSRQPFQLKKHAANLQALSAVP